MQKKVLVTGAVLALAASSARANPDPLPPTNFASSDTLREITKDIIAACGVGAQLLSTGGGSTLAGTRMNPVGSFAPNGQQQIAPQSRFLNSTECNYFNGVVPYPGEAALGPNAGQGIQIALDGLAVFHDSTEFSACRVLRYAGCMDIEDMNAKGNDANRDGDCNDPGDTPGLCYGNGTTGIDDGAGVALGSSGTAAIPLVNGRYCFTHWADALRIIYNGQHTHLTDSSASAACGINPPSASPLANKRCNSDVRWTLVSRWANMFDTTGDDGAGGCEDGNCPDGLRHAFRRDDVSGTTDVFLAVIGAPSISTGTSLFSVRTFCNGLEGEDLDPVRRPCEANSNTSLERESTCGTSPMRARKLAFDAVTGDPTGIHSGVCSHNAAILCTLNSQCGTGNTCIIGACSNNPAQPCANDATCGAGNLCRAAVNNTEGTCSNNAVQRCNVNADCGSGNTCNIFGDQGLVVSVSLPPEFVNQPNAVNKPLKDPAAARCSITSVTACAQDSDCPSGETCNGPDYDAQFDDNIFCSTSSLNTPVKLAPMPSTSNLVFQRCPNGNARVGNRCFWPIRQNNLSGQSPLKNGWYNCKARRNNRPNGSQWPNFDARAYNRVPRHPITGEILQPALVTNPAPDFRFLGGGDYRIHMTTPRTTLPNHPSCRLTDATRQLGCLVQADICSISYAGLEGEDQDTTPDEINVAGTNSPFAMRTQIDVAGTCSNNPSVSCNLDLDCGPPASGFVCVNGTTLENGEINSGDDLEVLPTITTIRRLTHASETACGVGGSVPSDYDVRYPLSRLLWVNAAKGFGSGFPDFTSVKNVVDADPDFTQLDPTIINGAQTPNGSIGPEDVTTNENALLKCFANFRVNPLPVAIDLDHDPGTPPETVTLDDVIEHHGFVTLPPANVYPDSTRLKSCP